MSRARISQLLCLCGLIFTATVAGSIACGTQLSDACITADKALYLRRLIYFHFALSQICVLTALYLLYITRFKARRSNLIVSYNERGLHLCPPGIKLRTHTTYHCSLGKMRQAQLPPADKPIIVYPLMLQSGYSSGEKLEKELRETYAERGLKPELYIQPVIGANPWLAQAAAAMLREQCCEDGAILVIAHDTAPGQPPAPEPELFCQRLRKRLPHTRISLYLIGNTPGSEGALKHMSTLNETNIYLLPFLLTEGVHYHRDLPTPEQAQGIGKKLISLPVLGKLLCLPEQGK